MAQEVHIEKKTEEKINEVCGIVMPISTIDGCNEAHWGDVLEILNESIGDAGFTPNLVSNADEIGVIQKRIVQNLYTNPVVICDVSGKNPNVMFELGIRLAFDKPTIIIKDDKTSYSFDTAPIEHLTYPRDLRFNKMVEFKSILTEKIKSTFQASQNDANYSTFLKHFGEFKIPKLDQREVSGEEFILDELRSLRNIIINNSKPNRTVAIGARPKSRIEVRAEGSMTPGDMASILAENNINGISSFERIPLPASGRMLFKIYLNDNSELSTIGKKLIEIFGDNVIVKDYR